MKIIPIPVGYMVKYELGGRSFEGIVNKVMMPGYKFHLTPESNDRLRYCITRLDDIEFGAVIYENMIKDPDIHKLYFDQDYQVKKLSEFKQYNSTKSKRLDPKQLLNLLASNVKNISGGDFMIRVINRDYYIQKIESKYNKITFYITTDKRSKLSNTVIIDKIIELGSTDYSISVFPGECGISGLIIDKNPIFTCEF